MWIALFLLPIKSWLTMQDTEHHISRSFAHDLSSWVVTGIKQMKTYTEYYTFKAVFVEKDEDWLQLNNWATPEGRIWNE